MLLPCNDHVLLANVRLLTTTFFLSFSCQYGDRCKFLHVSPQQSKPNPFGFSTQNPSQLLQSTQQQKSNPFGFGIQNSSQGKDFGARFQGSPKAFENKWTRTANTNPSQQPDSHPQAAVHKCTDPDQCKRQIVDDFKNEAPLWRLTCYGHWKNLPCDITGDISYEELRAAAYEDAKQGISLQSIIDRERNLLNSKLTEFDNLLRRPYVASPSPSSSGLSQVPGINNSSQLLSDQNNGPPSFSSFSQLGASTNLVSSRTQVPGDQQNISFGQAGGLSQNTNQISSGSEMKFGMPGVFASQLPIQPPGFFPSSNTFNFNNGVMPSGSHSMALPTISPPLATSRTNPLPSFANGPQFTADTTVSKSPIMDKEEAGSDDNPIWLKEKWEVGEIPEEEPPQRYC